MFIFVSLVMSRLPFFTATTVRASSQTLYLRGLQSWPVVVGSSKSRGRKPGEILRWFEVVLGPVHIDPGKKMKTQKTFSVHTNPVAKTRKMFSVHTNPVEKTNLFENVDVTMNMCACSTRVHALPLSGFHRGQTSRAVFRYISRDFIHS